MSIRFDVDASGLEISMLAFSRSLSGGFARSLGEADGVLRRAIDLNFRRGGRPLPWKDVKPATRRRRRINKTAPPLTDSRQLRGSLTSSGAPFSVRERDPFSAFRGTSRPDAGRHLYGFGGEPARDFLALPPQDVNQVFQIFASDVEGRCRRIEKGTP